MIFQALYFGDRIRVINPSADVGIVTLWSPPTTVLKLLGELGIDLTPERSRVAAVANLYGDGLETMVRNLHWNPQIRHLLVLGQDLSSSARDLESLLTRGTETAAAYGRSWSRVQGTSRLLDPGILPDRLTGRIALTRLGGLSKEGTRPGVVRFFAELPDPRRVEDDRLALPEPAPPPARFPSLPTGHSILREDPFEAWEELVFCLVRFGVSMALDAERTRLELYNLKVVVTEPRACSPAQLEAAGCSTEAVAAYRRHILQPELPEGIAYTYGNRLRGYFGDGGHSADLLAAVADRIRAYPPSRKGFLSLWDSRRDPFLEEHDSAPCLSSLFFCTIEGRLSLSAVFRAQDAVRAWLLNFHGLLALQELVCERTGLPAGPITLLSHCLSLDPADPPAMERALAVSVGRTGGGVSADGTDRRRLREDPQGYFVIEIDAAHRQIVADLKQEGRLLKRYVGRTSLEIERQLVRDRALSDLQHALYVGRTLARAEAQLEERARQGSPDGEDR